MKGTSLEFHLQGCLGLKRSKSAKNGLVRAITRHAFELGSPNLHQLYIMGPFRALLKTGSIHLDLLGYLGAKTVQIREKLAFPRDNTSHPRSRIIKFAPNWYLGTLQKPIQGHLGIKLSKSAKNGLVGTIIGHAFQLESPN